MIRLEESPWNLTILHNSKWLNTNACQYYYSATIIPSNSHPVPVVRNSCAQEMVDDTESNGIHLKKDGFNKPLESSKFSKFRITVEPLGFLYLIANIIQVVALIHFKISSLINHDFFPANSRLSRLICFFTKFARSISKSTPRSAIPVVKWTATILNSRIVFRVTSVLWIFTARSLTTFLQFSWCFFYYHGATSTEESLWW
jgi:hypothetical protein